MSLLGLVHGRRTLLFGWRFSLWLFGLVLVLVLAYIIDSGMLRLSALYNTIHISTIKLIHAFLFLFFLLSFFCFVLFFGGKGGGGRRKGRQGEGEGGGTMDQFST